MAYKISVKGHDDIRVGTVRGEDLKEDWKEYKQGSGENSVIELQGFTGQLSDIYNFRYVEDQKDRQGDTDKHSRKVKQIQKEAFQDYKQKLEKTSEQLVADSREYVRMWEFAITGDDSVPDERKLDYKWCLYNFFEENEYRTVPDLTTLDMVLPRERANAETEMQHNAQSASVRVLVGSIRTDRNYASNRGDED